MGYFFGLLCILITLKRYDSDGTPVAEMKMMPSGYPVSTDREYFQYCDVSISVFLETGQQGPPGGSGFPIPGPAGPRGDTGITGRQGATGFPGKLIEKDLLLCTFLSIPSPSIWHQSK